MNWKEKRENAYCEITPAILALKEQWEKKNYIDSRLYKEYNVKRGLRDEDGRGVLTGLTRVAEIQSYRVTNEADGEHIAPTEGALYYRGIDCRHLVTGSESRGRFAFEEAAYLLLFGELPTEQQLKDFCVQLASYRTLPTNFFRDIIMKTPPKDLMNTMQRAILTLFCYDDKPNDISLENVLRQCLQLTANMPVLAIYAYQAWRYSQGESLFIHQPLPELSTAENFLRMLREDCSYTELEARTLDVALVLHADNGGGNNSTFTNHVVTSSGTDTYSAISAAMASLKGPRHGGANSKVMEMMADIKSHVVNWDDETCVADYLTRILDKEAFDRSGLIYGLGKNAEFIDGLKHADEYGISISNTVFNITQAVERKDKIVNQLASGIETLLKTNNVSIVKGHADFVDSHTVSVGNEQFTAENIIIATM